jgi:hypothetical protein
MGKSQKFCEDTLDKNCNHNSRSFRCEHISRYLPLKQKEKRLL